VTRRRGGPHDLQGALAALTKRLDRKSGGALRQIRVAEAWEKVAGPTAAAHTTGAHLRGAELVVSVDSPAWATELTALAGPYSEAINVEMGQTAVRSIRFTVSRKVDNDKARRRAEEESDDFYRPDPVDPIPLSEVEKAQVEASAAVIEDEGLREAVIKATVAHLELMKGVQAATSREEGREGP